MITVHRIRDHFPRRMDTRKFHAELEARKKAATKALKKELRKKGINK